MERAWPFAGKEERARAVERFRTPQDFVAKRREGTEAVIVRIGLNDAQLVLVDADGAWDRWVYPSVEEATKVAQRLDIPIHTGDYPEAVRVRMNARRRPQEDFDRGAYKEQGHVGPVIAYPENRPRVVGDRHEKEASETS